MSKMFRVLLTYEYLIKQHSYEYLLMCVLSQVWRTIFFYLLLLIIYGLASGVELVRTILGGTVLFTVGMSLNFWS